MKPYIICHMLCSINGRIKNKGLFMNFKDDAPQAIPD